MAGRYTIRPETTGGCGLIRWIGIQLGSDEGEDLVSVRAAVTASMGHLIVAQESEQAHRQIAERGHSARIIFTPNLRTIFIKGDICRVPPNAF